MALRSKNIYGPYEQKVVISDSSKGINFGIHQGALVQTQTGQWWTMLFVDRGAFGRFPSLQPVTWVDGWPMVGVNGHGVISYKKPNVGKTYPMKSLPTSDEFNHNYLAMQWGWNHNPDATKWSLTQRPGYLRLHTVNVVSDFTWARNTLTQRPFAHYDQNVPTVATIKMDVSKMKEGDIAGLAVFQIPYAYIAVKQVSGQKYMEMINNGETIDSIKINESLVYLRATMSIKTNKASFAFSTDNKNFKPLGNELHMQFSLKIFTGNKFCLFNYPTKSTGGIVDIDWFRVKINFYKMETEIKY